MKLIGKVVAIYDKSTHTDNIERVDIRVNGASNIFDSLRVKNEDGFTLGQEVVINVDRVKSEVEG
jgi:hypothetical protein